ncbi:blue copper protein-like [Durio zibethinus]|uniref:Blue copper protein-like n=1 Tax=Durio zibethinus TaxID=66656 RepID=A0A6P6ANF5_DURZI|nr:blue copper protein-like [Durio zibethinus]
MSSSGSGVAMACLVLVISCMVMPTLQHAVFTVGESIGWIPGFDYNAWAETKHFKVGDSLVFDYPSGLTVDEVFENDYNTCTVGNPITSDNSGSTTIPLLTAGPHYFICGVVGYCSRGMKLLVNVMAESTPLLSGRTPSLATNTTASSP